VPEKLAKLKSCS